MDKNIDDIEAAFNDNYSSTLESIYFIIEKLNATINKFSYDQKENTKNLINIFIAIEFVNILLIMVSYIFIVILWVK